jgi:hypothetical protein
MFNKIIKSIDVILEKTNSNYKDIRDDIKKIDSLVKKTNDKLQYEIDSAQRIIERQQKTIEQLIGALKDKYEHGLFILSEDGKMPMVIRNGKELTDNLTQSFSIDWTPGEIPYIEFTQVGATWEDDEKVEKRII